MTTDAYAACQKQVRILSNAKALAPLGVRMLEISLEGMNVPVDRIREIVREVIQRGRDQSEARRAARDGVRNENP